MIQLLRLVPADGDPRRCVAALVDLDPDGTCRSSGRIILGGAEGGAGGSESSNNERLRRFCLQETEQPEQGGNIEANLHTNVRS